MQIDKINSTNFQAVNSKQAHNLLFSRLNRPKKYLKYKDFISFQSCLSRLNIFSNVVLCIFSMNKIHSWIYYSLMKCILKYHDYLLCLKYHSRHCTGEADRNVFPCRIPDPVGDKEKQLAICRTITMIRLDLWLIISPIESVTKSFLKKVKKYFFFWMHSNIYCNEERTNN